MIELFILLAFLLVFFGVYYKDYRDQKHIDSLLKTMSQSLEKTNSAFYQMAASIQIEHFKQMEKQSAKANALFDKNIDKLLSLVSQMRKEQKEKVVEAERILRLSEMAEEKNQIEKGVEDENPLDTLSAVDFLNVKNVSFENEEEIYPIGPE